MLQSPLFVSTDSVSDTDSEDFDSDIYDDDNDSIDSEDISPVEIDNQIRNRLDSQVQITDGVTTVIFGANENEEKDLQFSTNPFAANYRKKADWDPEVKARWEKEWWFVKDVVEKYESVEHAEFTRPFDQFRVLLENRNLREAYERLCSAAPDAITRSCDVMNMLLEAAPELIVRYAALEKLVTERVAAMERGEKPSWEVQWEKRITAELGPWGTPRVC